MYVLLTVDLNNVKDTKKRDTFNDELKKKQWKKFRDTTTTWWAKFQDGTSASGAITTTKQEVGAAAIAAGIASWDAVCHAGEDEPAVF